MSKRKPYRPRRVTIPMMFLSQSVTDKYHDLPLSLYGQIYAFIERPNVESSNNLSRQLCCIAGGMSHMLNGKPIKGRRDSGSVAICSAVSCMSAIAERFDRTGVIAVNESEAQTLKAAAGRLDEVLQGMPLACYLKAEAEAHLWLRESEREVEAA